MLVTASRVRTSLAISAAGATVVAALALSPATPAPVSTIVAATAQADDGVQLTARLTSRQVLGGEQAIAITVTAPSGGARVRPPLSLAVVIDRSGSMSGAPLANAKAAAARLVEQLSPNDAFSIVTYSSSDETVMPMGRATAANKRVAQREIATIVDDGGTCISCGLDRGARELAASPLERSVQRIVLISDGQANEGIDDRDALAELARTKAAGGTSITTVGVGLDFDEVTMQRLAEVGRGNYYFVEHTATLDTMFAEELGGLAETVGSDVRLSITEGPGVQILEAYGYPMLRSGNAVSIPVADLRAGETRKVVLRAVVSGELGPRTLSTVQLGWRRVSDGVGRRATAIASATIVTDGAAVAASVDADAAAAAEQAESSRAMEDATRAYEQHGAGAAQAVLQRRVEVAKKKGYLDAKTLRVIESDAGTASADFIAAPSPTSSAGAKVRKASRAKAYELAR